MQQKKERPAQRKSVRPLGQRKLARRKKAVHYAWKPVDPLRPMDSIPSSCKTPLAACIVFLLVLILVSSAYGSDPPPSVSEGAPPQAWLDLGFRQGSADCLSNQQCLMDSTDAYDNGYSDEIRPFCWPNRRCNTQRQLVMTITKQEGSNGEDARGMVTFSKETETNQHRSVVDHPDPSPYPVFHEGDVMCVTVMINPSLVLVDSLWDDEQKEKSRVTAQQNRLVLFQSIPLRFSVDLLWMCSSDKNENPRAHADKVTGAFPHFEKSPPTIDWSTRRKEKEAQEDVMPHSFVQHFDGERPRSTGCFSKHSSLRKELVYDAQNPQNKNKVDVYPSESGLTTKLCFPASVLGPPDVPSLVHAQILVQVERKDSEQDLGPYAKLIQSFGIDDKSVDKHEEEENKTKRHSEKCIPVEDETNKEPTKHLRSHGNRGAHKKNKRNEMEAPLCKEPSSSPRASDSRNVALITVTSADTLSPGPAVTRGKKQTVAEGQGKQVEYELHHEEEEVQTAHSRARTVGYYYYYDPYYGGYYYYHPHVHCDWDLEFHHGAGICEIPGRLHENSLHVFVLIFAPIGFAAGLVFFALDWKSRVLFTH